MGRLPTFGKLGLIALLATGCVAEIERPPKAQNGVLDLRQWEAGEDGLVRLEGEWRYFPLRILPPDDPAIHSPAADRARVPHTWGAEATPPGAKRGHGFATYALTLQLPAGQPSLAVRLITTSTAFRLFADGELVASAGTVAETPAEGHPEYRPQVAGLPTAPDGTLDLVLQVSNFHYARGGPWEPIWIGSWDAIRSAREERIALALFLAGSFAVIGLYHLALWGARRPDPSPLYFAFVCFAMALRGLTLDEVFLIDLLPGISWPSLVRLEYGSLLAIVAATPLFLRQLFPDEHPRPLIFGYSGAALAGLLLVSLLPPDLFSRGLPFLQLLCVSAAVVGAVLVARALMHGREGAALFLIGLLAIAVTGVHDVLISIFRSLPTGTWLATTIYLQPFGLFVFVLSQAVLLSRRSSHAFAALQKASHELEVAHTALDAHAKELEQRVAERTGELQHANQQLAKLSEIDPLTAVGNRRFFDEELSRSWNDQLRRQTPLSLLLVDVDHFKAYNDHHGHLAGDEVLREVALAVERCARRPVDSVARYGGDELVAVLPNTTAEGAEHLARLIQQGVAGAAIPHSATQAAPRVTVSIGVATMVPQQGTDRSALLEAADRALYRAKQEGRNRIAAA